jgi:hypothetical protein
MGQEKETLTKRLINNKVINTTSTRFSQITKPT